MEAKKYDALVKVLLDGLGISDDEAIKVVVEPHQVTGTILHDRKEGLLKEVVIERDEPTKTPDATKAAIGKAIVEAITEHEKVISRMDPPAKKLIREYDATRDAK